jgi:hypothetical protein
VKPLTPQDPWHSLYHARRRVIACATVIEEMLPLLTPDIPYEVLDFGLHLNPAGLKKTLQDRIILGYGLCSMAVVGLQARGATLVIPRSDDCIALFLGSCNAYRVQSRAEPGTYYLTKGWIEVGDTPFEEHRQLVEKYGPERAERMTRLLLKNYTRLAFINTGQRDLARYQDYARQAAEKFSLRYEEIQGSSALIEKMLHGPWDEEFVVVPPGETVTFQPFAHSAVGSELPA